MNLRALSRRERLLAIGTAMCVVTGLGARFIVGPAWERWRTVRHAIDATRADVEQYQQILERRARVSTEYERYATLVRLPGSDEEGMAVVLQGIEARARQASVHITDINPKPVQATERSKTFVVEVKAEGEIQKLAQFIYELQRPPELLRVDRLRLSAKSGERRRSDRSFCSQELAFLRH